LKIMAKLPKRSNLHRPRNTADHASATDAAAHTAHSAHAAADTAHSAHAAEPSTGYTENRVSGKRVYPNKIQMGIPKLSVGMGIPKIVCQENGYTQLKFKWVYLRQWVVTSRLLRHRGVINEKRTAYN
jgi:hypothetical protein